MVVICGDCIEELTRLKNESIDLVVIDPPYNKNKGFANDNLSESKFYNFTREWFFVLYAKMKKTASFYCFINEDNIITFKSIFDKLLCFKRILIWHFEQSYAHFPKNYINRTEYILFYTKSDDYTFNDVFHEKPSISTIKRWSNSVDKDGNIPYEKLMPSLRERYKKENYDKNPINIYRGAKKSNVFVEHRPRMKQRETINHETQKPEELIMKLILISSNENDVVLDCFSGSGTTLVAAKKCKRKYIGIEINKEYCKKITERLQKTHVTKSMF